MLQLQMQHWGAVRTLKAPLNGPEKLCEGKGFFSPPGYFHDSYLFFFSKSIQVTVSLFHTYTSFPAQPPLNGSRPSLDS